MRVNGEMGERSLLHCFWLVGGAIYDVANVRWPDWASIYCPDGPSQLMLSRTDLLSTLTWFSVEDARTEKLKREILPAIGECRPPLRNSAYHPVVDRTVAQYDELLACGQRIVVASEDEARAVEIRELRDKMRGEAERTWNEIQSQDG